MSRETPLVSKTLSLVSFAIIIVIVALVLSGAYSGYEEYSALTGAVNPASSSTQSSQSQLSANINGSKLTISGLNVPNRMTYPLGLALI